MPDQHNQSENRVEEKKQQQWFFEARLNYFVSEIMNRLDIDDTDEITMSLKRAFQACDILHLPIHRNFKRVYRFDGEKMIADWKISGLACYLVIINCNPGNENVAKAQLYFAMNRAVYK
ncbi:MAG: hypothetical protein SGI96_15450 [Bacteroidota bacterium]|nr:hypothetical protein [Bacteroidota bacterium]